MKLNDTINKSLSDVLKECEVMSVQYYTDDDGKVRNIQIKYVPNDCIAEDKGIKPPPAFVNKY